METTARPVLRSRVWPLAGGLVGALVLVLATLGVDRPVTALVVLLVATATTAGVLAWALVRSRRERRAYEDDLTAWAAERAAQAERLRIARDLHDLASHGLGLITVRAAAARTVSGPDGEAERARALADIERAGRDATTELRRMLTVLRSPGDDAPLRPAETLDDLPHIVESARSAGLDVTFDVEDLTVSAGVGLGVCAVVREALANVLRHAGPTRAQVVLGRDAAGLRLVVEDEGPVAGWVPHPGAGVGLAGLRERVATLGGSLASGPCGRGFRVEAVLPDGGRS
ncbi:sensor histidine kinase [Oerskovia sp. KBS0722]|uniref:sensor histidine kinase n=1 Tax=Oerskovia sp. KBS0722 TaxID=1179673 RepID=UPI00110D9932|nr:histidine kinase [Oerskovia sp. KBS0722]QDW61316.1 histidine kinase [Oerskovia sp. KBS0722]